MKILSFALMSFFTMITLPAIASAGEAVTYTHGDTVLEGYLSKPDAEEFGGKRPVILIAHQWKGLGDYEKKRADMLADLGYIAFAVDVYGQGIRPETQEAASKESGKYKNDPELARGRMAAALDYARGLDNADTTNIAAIGYCFGGTMVLELARSGADIEGVVSFHGGLATNNHADEGDIKASVQVHHGAADPHVSDEEVSKFKSEMDNANADWHFISYADAVHAFTEKEAGSDPSSGVAYNAKADERSWAYTLEFFNMIFG